MRTVEQLEHRIAAILGGQLRNGVVRLDCSWKDYKQAKVLLSNLRRMQKDLRALKRDVSAIIRQLTSEYTTARVSVGKGAGTAIAGLFVSKKAIGKANALRRDELRRSKEHAIAPYRSLKGNIDDVIHKLETIKHDIEGSAEYQVRPAARNRTRVSKQRQLTTKSQRYFVLLDDKVKGPFSTEELEGLVKASVADANTQLCLEGEEDWHPLSHFFEI